MDNVCHTLLGAAFGETGLKWKTRWGNPVLMAAANLPDIDVLAFAADTPAVALRRGMTHGVMAQALLPLALTGVVLLLDRWRPAKNGRPRARAGPILLLSYLGMFSHVGLDWLNTYGIRLLMPFSQRWFYGDAVFIIDPWLWLVLGLGVLVARRAAWRMAAGVALAGAALYVTAMIWSTRGARQDVLDLWIREHGRPPAALMVGPSFANPMRRAIILQDGDRYLTGTLRWWPRRVEFQDTTIPRNDRHPSAIRATRDRRVRAVLVWARFPYYSVTTVDGGTRVTLADMRFPARLGSVAVIIPDE